MRPRSGSISDILMIAILLGLLIFSGAKLQQYKKQLNARDTTTATAHDCDYAAKATRVVDGDTIDAVIYLGFDVATKQRLRLYGIDAPEVRGPEREDGLESKEWLVERIEGQDITVATVRAASGSERKGKYGRYLAVIYKDDVDLNRRMVELGLAEESK